MRGIFQAKHARQPQSALRVGGAGIGSSLILAAMPGIAIRNLLDGSVPSAVLPGTGSQIGVGQYGRGLMIHPSGGSSGFGGLRFGVETIGASNDFTFVWVGRPQNFSNANGQLMVRGADSAGNGWNIALSYTAGSPTVGSAITATVIDSSPASFPVSITTLSLEKNRDERVALVKRGNVLSVFDWRTRAKASGSAGNGSLRTSTIGIGLGFATTSATTTAGHNEPNTVLAFESGLADADVWSLLDNPWQVIAPAPRSLLFDVASGGVQSLTVTPTGGITFSGAAATVRSSARQPVGGVSFSGAAPMVRGGVRTASGGVTLGGAATVSRGVVRAPSGGVVLSGAAPVAFDSVVQSITVTPTGGIAFSGAAPTVRQMIYTPVGGISFGGAAGYTNSGIVASPFSFKRRRILRRHFTP